MKEPLPPIQPWPPVLEGQRLPWLIRLRDLVLTGMAWWALLWLLRDWLDLLSTQVLGGLLPPGWEKGKVDLPLLMSRLRFFLLIAAVIIGWLLLRALRDLNRIRAAGLVPQPPPLPLEEQAQRFDLNPETAAEARRHKVMNVWFRDDGTIERFASK
jgi:poly-beta-1,6-N-acetyl-D-glucosamine biosynthesis protein PgaD